jgi:uncharacterized membrane protein
MGKFTTDYLVKSAIIAGLYVVVTLAFQPIGYGQVQFRISEVFVLFVFLDPSYLIGLTLGCAIANFFSPFGLVDVIFGTMATYIALIGIIHIRKIFGQSGKALFLASLMPVLSNGIIIGIQLNILLNLPLIPSIIFVALGEFVVVSIMGVVAFWKLGRNKKFVDYISIR